MNKQDQIPQAAKTLLDNAWNNIVGGMNWLQAVVLGEFIDDRPLSAVVTDMLVSFLPGVVIVTSARDAIAVVFRMATNPKRREDLMEWVLLCSCLIIIALPLAMAAGGAVIAGAGAVVGGIAGSELAAALRALMLLLIKKASKLVEVVQFLQKFMKGDVLKFVRDVKFVQYERSLVQAFIKINGKLIEIVVALREHLEKIIYFDAVKNNISKLAEFEKNFYDLQHEALIKIPMALVEIDTRLANVLMHAAPVEAHSVAAGTKINMPIGAAPARRKIKDIPGRVFPKQNYELVSYDKNIESIPQSIDQKKITSEGKLKEGGDSKILNRSTSSENTKKQAVVDAAIDADREKISRLAVEGQVVAAREILRPHVEAIKAAKTVDERKAVMDSIIDRLDVDSELKKYFWSGNKDLAGKVAKENGATILEQTPGGLVIDGWDELNDLFPWNKTAIGPYGWDFWGKVSSKYSRGAEGEITVVQDAKKFPRGGDIWRGYEWPALVEERKVTSINVFSMDRDGKILENVTLDPAGIEARKLFGED